MPFDIITKDDLENFRRKLIADIEALLKQSFRTVEQRPEGFKTADARKILNCSLNKLVSLRINGKIRTKKIGGTLYYNNSDLKALLEEGY